MSGDLPVVSEKSGRADHCIAADDTLFSTHKTYQALRIHTTTTRKRPPCVAAVVSCEFRSRWEVKAWVVSPDTIPLTCLDSSHSQSALQATMNLLQRAKESGRCAPSFLIEKNMKNDDGFESDLLGILADGNGAYVMTPRCNRWWRWCQI